MPRSRSWPSTGSFAELECDKKPMLLVLNKVDRLADFVVPARLAEASSALVATSAAARQGLDSLQDAVIEMLSADFAHVEVDLPPPTAAFFAYLSTHADVYRQQYVGDRLRLGCYMPRHLVRHIQEPDVHIRVIGEEVNGQTEKG